MPELNLSAFTEATDGFKTNDFLHIQRRVLGQWRDYRTSNYGLWGDNWQTAVVELSVINTLTTVVSATVGTGSLYVIGDAYAVWQPGSSNDNADLEVRLTSFNIGGSPTHYGGLVASATANATPIVPQTANFFYFGPGGIQAGFYGTSTTNGSVKVFFKYLATSFGF